MDILGGRAVFSDMAILAGTYVLAIAIVQIARYLKRFYVRRFANNINRQMKQILYGTLVHKKQRRIAPGSCRKCHDKSYSGCR